MNIDVVHPDLQRPLRRVPKVPLRLAPVRALINTVLHFMLTRSCISCRPQNLLTQQWR
jgi:hypothetical protein